jgi:hypothetical protein
VRSALIVSGATLYACPQLRDADFRTVPGDTLSRPDAGGTGGTAETDQTGGRGGTGGVSESPSSPDAGSMPDLQLDALRAALAHRYAFAGTGSIAFDSVGGSDATLINTTLDGSGSLILEDEGEYVDLPNGILSSRNDQTIEAWLTWNGGGAWQRIFDFGSSDAGEDERGNGRTYLFLTPRSSRGVLLLAYSATGYSGETRLSTDVAFPVGVQAHVAVVIDSPENSISLYLDGRWLARQTLEQRLSELEDVNCWLGMAQYQSDPGLSASLTEFRLYHRALTSAELELSHSLGPDGAL